MLTSGQIREALVGSELGGDLSLHYDASYAVSNKDWGQTGTGNHSGVSFGVVQLDIANNEYAKSMWKEVLRTNRDLITEDQFVEFVSYIDNKRPDTKVGFTDKVKAAVEAMGNLIAHPRSQPILDKWVDKYINDGLMPAVNKALKQLEAVFGAEVVSPQNPEFPTIAAAVVSMINRAPGTFAKKVLPDLLAATELTIAVVYEQYESEAYKGHWSLVETGALMLERLFGVEDDAQAEAIENALREALVDIALENGDVQTAARLTLERTDVYSDGIIRSAAGFEGSQMSAGSSGAVGTTSTISYSSGGTTHTASYINGGGGGGADSGQAANTGHGPSGSTSSTAGGEGAANNGHGPTGSTSTGTGSGSGSTSHNASNNRDRQGSGDHTATEDRRPILLDLDGNGVKITEFGKSSQFVAGKDGLMHRTSWAGAGDGVLFFDPDGRNAITEERQCVFTEWDPTATGDLEAIRSVFDSNGDGKLTAADADFAKFKVMVTNADGSTTVKTLAELGITEINLTANAVNIGMPDGSVITGQTTFTRANGTTGTVANTSLVAEAAGHRVVETVGTDGVNRVVEMRWAA